MEDKKEFTVEEFMTVDARTADGRIFGKTKEGEWKFHSWHEDDDRYIVVKRSVAKEK